MAGSAKKIFFAQTQIRFGLNAKIRVPKMMAAVAWKQLVADAVATAEINTCPHLFAYIIYFTFVINTGTSVCLLSFNRQYLAGGTKCTEILYHTVFALHSFNNRNLSSLFSYVFLFQSLSLFGISVAPSASSLLSSIWRIKSQRNIYIILLRERMGKKMVFSWVRKR